MARDQDPHERSEDERRLFAEERRRVEDAGSRGDGDGADEPAAATPDERAVREAKRRLEPDEAG